MLIAVLHSFYMGTRGRLGSESWFDYVVPKDWLEYVKPTKDAVVASALNVSTRHGATWVNDSGATRHMVQDRCLCFNVRKAKNITIKVADGKVITAKYIGDAVVSVIIGIDGYGDPMTRDMLFTRVLIALSLGHNLYSSRFGWEVDGIKTILNTLDGDDEYCMILPDGTSVELDRSTSSHCLIHTCNVATSIDKDELMHNRFGHAGAKRQAHQGRLQVVGLRAQARPEGLRVVQPQRARRQEEQDKHNGHCVHLLRRVHHQRYHGPVRVILGPPLQVRRLLLRLRDVLPDRLLPPGQGRQVGAPRAQDVHARL